MKKFVVTVIVVLAIATSVAPSFANTVSGDIDVINVSFDATVSGDIVIMSPETLASMKTEIAKAMKAEAAKARTEAVKEMAAEIAEALAKAREQGRVEAEAKAEAETKRLDYVIITIASTDVGLVTPSTKRERISFTEGAITGAAVTGAAVATYSYWDEIMSAISGMF